MHIKEKNITHSNTITGNNLNNNKLLNLPNNTNINNNMNNQRNINKGIFALGVNPDNATALNIFYEQSKATMKKLWILLPAFLIEII